MMMMKHIAAFEARYQLRSPLFVVSFVLFFLLSFGAVISPDIQIGGTRGSTHLNAPHAILMTVAVMHVMALFVVNAFVANVVIRDEEYGFAALLRATRVSKFDYLVGRFLGAMAVAFLVTLAVPLAIAVGSLMPWLDPEQLGPFVLQHYLYAQLVIGLPSLLLAGAALFALATLTRSMMWSYVGAVALLVLYGASRALLRDPSLDAAASLSDPFALSTLGRVTKYWTTADRNSLLPPLEGLLLQNRLIWLGVSALLFGLAYRGFSFEPRAARLKPASQTQAEAAAPAAKPLAAPRHGAAASRAQFWALARFDMRFVFKSPAFFVLLAMGVANALASLMMTVTERGIDYFPVTRSVVEALAGSFSLIPMLVAIYYAGELVLARSRAPHARDHRRQRGAELGLSGTQGAGHHRRAAGLLPGGHADRHGFPAGPWLHPSANRCLPALAGAAGPGHHAAAGHSGDLCPGPGAAQVCRLGSHAGLHGLQHGDVQPGPGAQALQLCGHGERAFVRYERHGPLLDRPRLAPGLLAGLRPDAAGGQPPDVAPWCGNPAAPAPEPAAPPPGRLVRPAAGRRLPWPGWAAAPGSSTTAMC